jgi:hypothetical protein
VFSAIDNVERSRLPLVAIAVMRQRVQSASA